MSVVYEQTFDPHQDRWLIDYRWGGAYAPPAGVCLEMALAGYRATLGRHACHLQRMSYRVRKVHDLQSPIVVRLQLAERAADGWSTFSVSVEDALGKRDRSQRAAAKVICRGRLSAAPRSPAERREEEAWNRLFVVADLRSTEAINAYLRQLGNSLGPTYQVIESLRVAGDVAIARLRMPPADAAAEMRWHPAALEAGIFTATAVLANSSDAPRFRGWTWEWARVKEAFINSALPPECQLQVQVPRAAPSNRAPNRIQMRWLDLAGSVLAEMRSVSLRPSAVASQDHARAPRAEEPSQPPLRQRPRAASHLPQGSALQVPAALPSTSPPSAEPPDRWFVERVWAPAKRPPEPRPIPPGTWVLLGGDESLVTSVTTRLRSPTHRVVYWTLNQALAASSQARVTLDAQDPESFLQAVARVQDSEPPLAGVVHLGLCSTTACSAAQPGVERNQAEHQAELDRGLRSLVWLAQGLARKVRTPVELWPVTTNSQPGVVSNPSLRPAGAALWGAARVIGHELSHVTVRGIDLVGQEFTPEQAAEILYQELTCDRKSEPELAWCDGRLLKPTYRNCPPDPSTRRETAPRLQGCYVVTGGQSGVGYELARSLAARGARTLLLAHRTPLPPEEHWNEFLAEHHAADDPRPTRIRNVRALRQGGATVIPVAIDVTDGAAVSELLAMARARYGELRGIIHAAGHLHDASLLTIEPAALDAVLAPKVIGAWHLHAATRQLPLDDFVLCSSVATWTGGAGQVAHAAANAFLDALAYARRDGSGSPAVSIGWGHWGETGVVAGEAQCRTLSARGVFPLDTLRAVRAFELAQDFARPHLAIADLDWPRMQLHVRPARESWQRQRAAGQAAAELAWRDLAPRMDALRGLDEALDEVAIRFAEACLAYLGLTTSALGEDIAHAASLAGVLPAYQPLLARWAEVIADAAGRQRNVSDSLPSSGNIGRWGKGHPAENDSAAHSAIKAWRLAAQQFPTADALWEMLRRGGQSAAKVLRGELDPLEVLFAEGRGDAAQAAYRETPFAAFDQQVAAGVLREALAGHPGDAPPRVLEVGAGTGATTQTLLPIVQAADGEYTITDVSTWFVRQTAARYQNLSSVFCETFDIERSGKSQGLTPQGFDVVVAANVVHATRDVVGSLRHLRRLLRPGGSLLLLETVRETPFALVTFALTREWWRFVDRCRRPTSPLLGEDGWVAALQAAGFREAAAVLHREPDLQALPHRVIVAQAGEVRHARKSALSRQRRAPSLPFSTEQPAITSRPKSPADLASNTSASGLAEIVRHELAAVLQTAPDRIEADRPFQELGLDSLMSVELIERLRHRLSVPSLRVGDLFSHASLARLCAFLTPQLPAVPSAAQQPAPCISPATAPHRTVATEHRPAASPHRRRSSARRKSATRKRARDRRHASPRDIAVIGYACRFAGAGDAEAFWQQLRAARDPIGPLSAARAHWEQAAGGDGAQTCVGGFLGYDDVATFDPQFFRITPTEAAAMEPRQRLFLQTAYHALEHSGYAGREWAGSPTGVFVGAGAQVAVAAPHAQQPPTHFATGITPSVLASRVSYFFDFRGPCLTVDTACSSSLVALHLAVESLRRGECQTALVGGVHLNIQPLNFAAYATMGALAANRRTKAFDDRADGFVPGEGVGAVVLKPLAAALADGDRVYGVIKGTATNNDGRSNGLSAPNPEAQRDVILAAWEDAHIDPTSLSYIEAHGTGTAVGDPIEVQGLTEAFRRHTQRRQFCRIGSVKTSIGHCEPAAGIASLIKVLLSLEHAELPASLHFESPNRHIQFEDTPLAVNDRLARWRSTHGPRRAGISSFGISGTNVHVVLEEAPASPDHASDRDAPAAALALSAASQEALEELADRFVEQLKRLDVHVPRTLRQAQTDESHPERAAPHSTMTSEPPRAGPPPEHCSPPPRSVPLAVLARTAAVGRPTLTQRLSVVGNDPGELAAALSRWRNQASSCPRASDPTTSENRAAQVALLLPGWERCWSAAAWDSFLATCPAWKQSYARSQRLLGKLASRSARAPSERIANDTSLPGLVARQLAWLEQWQVWGLMPELLLGWGAGEIAAGIAAGVWTIDDGLELAAHLANRTDRPQRALWVATEETDLKARQLLPARGLRLLATDAGASLWTGAGRSLAEWETRLRSQGIPAQPVGGPSDIVRLHRIAGQRANGDLPNPSITCRPARQPWFSAALGRLIAPGETIDLARWWRGCRTPVTIDWLRTQATAAGANLVLELDGGPRTSPTGAANVGPAADESASVSSLTIIRPTGDDLWRATLEVAGALWTRGSAIDWQAIYRPFVRGRVPLPSYPFEHRPIPAANHIASPSRHDAVLPVAPPTTAGDPFTATPASHHPGRTQVVAQLAALFSDSLGLEQRALQPRTNFQELGVDSLAAECVRRDLARALAVEIDATLLFAHPSLERLADYLSSHFPTSVARWLAGTKPPDSPPSMAASTQPASLPSTPNSHVASPQPPATQGVAIIGMACRLPGCETPHVFWQHLLAGDDLTGELSAERQALRRTTTEPTSATERGGFLQNIAQFDPAFFDLSLREARRMDPQQRLLLEVAWEAVETAGYRPEDLGGGNVGVFVGVSANEYLGLLAAAGQTDDAQTATGNSLAMLANRLSYLGNWRGPSLALDTACSASLSALHLACESLARGEISAAVVGASNLILSAHGTEACRRAGMLAADGLSKAFDDRADGYVRGEGVVVIVLKPLEQALADGDRVWAVVRGSAANHDGHNKAGLTAPNPLAQVAVMEAAYRRAGVAPSTLRLIEAHGTGTRIGDPLELSALTQVFSRAEATTAACALGTAKSVVGHLEAAAGLTGVVKAALSLFHRVLPPTLHVASPNRSIEFERSPFFLNDRPRPWPTTAFPPRAGVSSFGFGGSNVHVVLEAAPADSADQLLDPSARSLTTPRSCLLTLSARTAAALRALAQRYATALGELPPDALADFCYSAGVGRRIYEHRLALIAQTPAQFCELLDSVFNADASPTPTNAAEPPPILQLAYHPTCETTSTDADEALATCQVAAHQWLAGEHVDWLSLYAPRQPRRIPLPTYPFQRLHCWLTTSPGELHLGTTTSTASPDDWLWKINWQPTGELPAPVMVAPPPGRSQETPRSWLLLSDGSPVSQAIEQQFLARGDEVICVTAGHRFAQHGPRRFTLHPARGDSWAQLFMSLGDRLGENSHVLHAWNGLELPVSAVTADQLTDRLAEGTLSLSLLLHAWVQSRGRAPQSLCLLTRGAQTTGHDGACQPEAAAAWGLLRAAAREFPESTLRAVDLWDVPATISPPYMSRLLAELRYGTQPQLALSPTGRFLPHHSQLRFPSPAKARLGALRSRGTYWITGGLGGIGRALARHLAEHWQARLILSGRSLGHEPLAPSAPPHDATVADRFCAELRQLGGSAIYEPCDVTDSVQLRGLIQQTRERFGPIHGIVHAAGTWEHALLRDLSIDDARQVLAVKLQGAWLLDELTADDPPDWLAVFSSLAGWDGNLFQAHYSAASRGLDAFAQWRNAQGRRTLSLDWCTWSEAGRAVGTGAANLRRADWIPTATALACWERSLACEESLLQVRPPHLAAPTAVAVAPHSPTAPAAPLPVDSAATAPWLIERMQDWLSACLAEIWERSAEQLDRDLPFWEQGMDSVLAAETAAQLSHRLHTPLPVTLLLDHGNIPRLAHALITQYACHVPGGPAPPAPTSMPQVNASPALGSGSTREALRTAPAAMGCVTREGDVIGAEPIAIIAASGRFPQADDLAEFWDLLCRGVDAVTPLPAERCRETALSAALRSSDSHAPARDWRGSFLTGLDTFDAEYFRLTPREAAAMDPQQRILLELVAEALDTAGYGGRSLAGTNTAVYVAARPVAAHIGADIADPYFATGTAPALLANRISYWLDLAGSSLVLDTACSSALVALHLAVESLRRGTSQMAIVAAVQAGLSPLHFHTLEHLGALAGRGRCRPFDAAADGYVPGEGGGALLLKPWARAQADGDVVLGLIRGTAVNHVGRSAGLTVPRREAQAQVLRQALADAGVSPESIGYLEAHGTGTSLGDPIELQAIADAWRTLSSRRQFCALGSVKGNLGHLEAAAGMAGLLKALLTVDHGQLPPTVPLEAANPAIDFTESPCYVVDRLQPWPDQIEPRRAAVSAFGFGGTNAHVILEQAPARSPVAADSTAVPRSYICTLSADQPASLLASAQRLADHLEQSPQIDWANVCFTLDTGRTERRARLAFCATDAPQAIHTLRRFATRGRLEHDAAHRLWYRQLSSTRRAKVAWLFTGQGSIYPGMGSALFQHEPVFRAAVERCSHHVADRLSISPVDVIRGDVSADLLRELAPVAQVALFSVEYALAQLWLHWGLTPAALLGHSLGEYVAAAVAHVFTVEQALDLVLARALAMQRLPATGAMLAVRGSRSAIDELLAELPGALSLAAVNSDEECVLAGMRSELETTQHAASERGLVAHWLDTTHAFHSPLIVPALDDLDAAAQRIEHRPPQIPLVSNITGHFFAEDSGPDAAYWSRHAQATVRFADGVRSLVKAGITGVLELGPRPVLATLARSIAGEHFDFTLAALGPHRSAQEVGAEVLAQLFVQGASPDWKAVFSATPARRMLVPVYPFAKRSLVATPATAELAAPPQTDHAASCDDAPLEAASPLTCWLPTFVPQVPRLTRPVPAGTWLILDLGGELAQALATQLVEQGHSVVVLDAQPDRAQNSPVVGLPRIAIDPHAEGQLAQQLAQVAAAHPELVGVVTAVPVAGKPADTAYGDGSTSNAPNCLAPPTELFLLVELGRALSHWHAEQCSDRPPIELWVVTVGGHPLADWGAEHAHDARPDSSTADRLRDPIEPTAAAIATLARILPQECTGVACHAVDLSHELDCAEAASLVLQAIRQEGAPAVAALRGDRWLIPRLASQRAPTSQPQRMLPAGSVFLVTGGLGDLGSQLALELAQRTPRATLILMGQTELPPEANDPAFLLPSTSNDVLQVRIQRLQQLRDTGAHVAYLSADVSDLSSMRTAIGRLLAQYGRLDGVIHVAGATEDGSLWTRTRSAMRHTWQAKVAGALALCQALAEAKLAPACDALGDHVAGVAAALPDPHPAPLGFFVLCSSFSAHYGGVGHATYAAANAAAIALVHQLRRHGWPALAINWGPWDGTRAAAPPAYRQALAESGVIPLDPPRARRFLIDSLPPTTAEWGPIRFAPALAADDTSPALTPTATTRSAKAAHSAANHLCSRVRADWLERAPRARTLGTAIDQFVAASVAQTLVQTGLFRRVGARHEREEIQTRLGVAPHLVSAWNDLLLTLVEDGALVATGSRLRATRSLARLVPAKVEELSELFPDFALPLQLLARCGQHLPDILRGTTDAAHLLYDASAAAATQAIFTDTPGQQIVARMAAAALRGWLLQRTPATPVRLLEIGAGTGAATGRLLPVLESHAAEYWFTDVSPAFFTRAEERFGRRSWIHYRPLDIEHSPLTQGFPQHAFDVVVAANVLHATSRLQSSLEHVGQLLAPGGLLLLIESTRPSRFAALTFGLTKGWWRFAGDPARPHGPLLTAPDWSAQLAQAGLASVASIPAENDPAAELLDQRLLCAVAPTTRQMLPAETPERNHLPAADLSAGVPSPPHADTATREPRATALSLAGDQEADTELIVWLRRELRDVVAGSLRVNSTTLDDDVPLSEQGVDSLILLEIVRRMQSRLGMDAISPPLIFAYPTIARLAIHLAANHGALLSPHVKSTSPSTAPPARDDVPSPTTFAPSSAPNLRSVTHQPTNPPTHEPIAIIGFACRFPGATDGHAFWHILESGQDTVSAWPATRDAQSTEDAHATSLRRPLSFIDCQGGFLADVDRFDPLFFRISPREAAQMDPRQRLFLETAYRAAEHAGHAGGTLEATRTGVFVGAGSGAPAASLAPQDPVEFLATGYAPANLASRLAYFFDLHGPCLTVDTACSSSLVAVHLAMQSLRRRECSFAFAGGVQLNLAADHFELFRRLGALATTGRCRPFDAAADGFVPAEGVGVLLLRPLADALVDGDSVYGVLRGSASNNDGRSNGLTAPNPAAQRDVLIDAWQDAELNPETLNYIEAHGTGTPLGDPIEVAALCDAFSRYTTRRQFCRLGSVKSNIGHAEAASGVASLIKVLLSLAHEQIPPSLHLHNPNPQIRFEESPFILCDSATPWLRNGTPRRAGVSAFGFSGTNVHVVIEEAPRETISDD